MKKDTLQPKEVKFWAGWIPVRTTIMIAMIVMLLSAFIPATSKLNKQIVILVGITYVTLVAVIAIFVWRWGSKQPKYQISYLKEKMESHKRSLENMNKEKTWAENQSEWHKNRFKEAEKMFFDLKIV